jgi:hypothetical protein
MTHDNLFPQDSDNSQHILVKANVKQHATFFLKSLLMEFGVVPACMSTHWK